MKFLEWIYESDLRGAVFSTMVFLLLMALLVGVADAANVIEVTF